MPSQSLSFVGARPCVVANGRYGETRMPPLDPERSVNLLQSSRSRDKLSEAARVYRIASMEQYLAASKSCCWRWNHTQLHHQPKRVHEDARLLDFAAFEAVDDHAPNRYRSFRSGDAEKCPAMRTCPLEA